jgi:predicted DNA-binding transcriptional regulator AlpA
MAATATSKLLTVKQVLELADISRNTLYKWERERRIPVPHRNVSGHRVFTEEQAEEIRRYAKTLYPPTTDVLRNRSRKSGKP